MSWSRALPWIALLIAAGLLLGGVPLPAWLGGGGDGELEPGGEVNARVERVVDGDTIKVTLDGRSERVRYIGIDTPESVKPNAPVECYGPVAAKANERLLGGPGARVTLRFDRELRDRYERLLAYVYRAEDGAFVNAQLVRGGFARTLPIRPNVAHARELAQLEADARAAARGLWGACRSR